MKKLITILFSCTCLSAAPQSLTNNSTISISSSAVLFVKQDLTNNGLIINNGDMQIGGAWQNNDQYDAGIGKITFNTDTSEEKSDCNQSE
jgi:hypothetical protein